MPSCGVTSLGYWLALTEPSLVDDSAERLRESSRAALESFTEPIAMFHQIHTYTELRQQIHDDLRIQHPEWVEPNGECPTCDSYESRLAGLLETFTGAESNESIVATHRVREHGLN